jgi:hypothetical protein
VLRAVLSVDELERAAREKGEALVQSMRETAEAELTARLKSAEKAIWSRLIEISNAFEQWRDESTEYIGKRLTSVIGAYLETLTLTVPGEAKALAALRQLIDQVGPAHGARLLVPADAIEAVRATALPNGWTAEPSASLQSGECRLVVSHGEWSVSFDGMLVHFLDTLKSIERGAGDTQATLSGTG